MTNLDVALDVTQELITIETNLTLTSFGDAVSLHNDVLKLYKIIYSVVSSSQTASYFPLNFLYSLPKFQSVSRSILDANYANIRENNAQNLSQIEEVCRIKSTEESSLWSIEFWDKIECLEGWDKCSVLNILSQTILNTMAEEKFEEEIKFLEPTAIQKDLCKNGLKLLGILAPSLARHTVSLTKSFIIVEAPFSSAYINEAPLTFMINHRILNDPLLVADTFLHESLHEKLANIRVTHHLLAAGYDDPTSELDGNIQLPWPDCETNPRKFSVARALATYHYYAHSAFLHLKANFYRGSVAVLESYSSEEIMYRASRSFNRACFLQDKLENPICYKDLGSDGNYFLKWMAGHMKKLSPFFDVSTLPKISS